MTAKLFTREIVPHVGIFAALVGSTVLVDALLHALGAVWVGRWLGIAGVVLIIGSFAYSLRKRKLITAGQPGALLRAHERIAWVGSLLVLVHGGIHFNAILAWLAVGAMLINVASGLTGKYLLERSRQRLVEAQTRLSAQGLAPQALDEHLYWDSLTFDAVKNWRDVHFPIALAFAVLALGHLGAVFALWSWR